jgi:8-oxo-dGTP diphosphatase
VRDPLQELVAAAAQDGIEAAVVGIVVTQGDAVLLLKRRPDDYLPNMWEVPGGHLEAGETVRDAVVRELQEETGLRVLEVGDLVSHFDYDGEEGRTREWNFRVIWRADGPIRHPEHVAMAWVTRDDWVNYPMTPEMRSLLALILAP